MVDVVAERGWEAATVRGMIERAGVTQVEFDRRFAGKEDCAQKIFEVFKQDFEWRVGSAYDRADDWRTGLRAAAYATADWMEAAPHLIQFGALEILKMESEMARVRREEAFIFCGALIDGGRAAAADPAAVPESAAMVAAGSIIHLMIHRLQKGDEIDPAGIVPEMMYRVVRIYLGEEIAREELTMPRPDEGSS